MKQVFIKEFFKADPLIMILMIVLFVIFTSFIIGATIKEMRNK